MSFLCLATVKITKTGFLNIKMNYMRYYKNINSINLKMDLNIMNFIKLFKKYIRFKYI